jgi:hypothetical protein
VSQLTDQTRNKMIMIGNGPFKMEAPANEQQSCRAQRPGRRRHATPGEARQDHLQGHKDVESSATI